MPTNNAAEHATTGHTSRLLELDLLRFLAALAVVFYHWAFRGQAADGLSQFSYPELAPVAKYGYLGVQLFFAISGFVILRSARSGSVRAFVVSRFVRLYPAFWFCCTLTFFCLLALRAQSPSLLPRFEDYLMNLSMFSGFLGVPSIDGAYWSLFVEMRFYLMVAAVLALRWLPHTERLLWLWLVLVVVAVVTQRGRIAEWLIAAYAAFFIAGAVLSLVSDTGWSMSRVSLLLCTAALATWQQTAALPALSAHYATPFSESVVVALVAAVFAVMTLVATGRLAFLGHPFCTPLGAMTYPLYLLHQNIGYAVFDSWMGTVDRHLLFWGSLVGALVLAFATHRWLEVPTARWLKAKLIPDRRRLRAHGGDQPR